MHAKQKNIRLHFTSGDMVYQLRRRTGINQYEFWTPIGITQSGGSRYESGRGIPKPVQLLLEVAYGTTAQSAAAVEQLRANVADDNSHAPDGTDAMSHEEERLISLWRKADGRLKQSIMAVANLAK